MIAPSIPRHRALPLLLVSIATVAFIMTPSIVGCLLQQPRVLAADARPQAAVGAQAIVLKSPNGKFTVRIEATDEGCALKLSEGERECTLKLGTAVGSLALRSGGCDAVATSSKGYGAFTVGDPAGGKMSTCYVFSHFDDTGRHQASESAFACYDMTKGPPRAANAALFADSTGVGKLQLLCGDKQLVVSPEDDEPAGVFDKAEPPKETHRSDNIRSGLVILD